MPTFGRFLVVVATTALLAAATASSIDGQWVLIDRTMIKNGKTVPLKQVLNLTFDGKQLSGYISFVAGDAEVREPIQNARFDGANFSFTIVRTLPEGRFQTVWEGTVSGKTLSVGVSTQGKQASPTGRSFTSVKP